MNSLDLPFFDDEHRTLGQRVDALCGDRLAPLAGTELEDAQSAAIEYIALFGQEGLFDPALGRALEGEAPRPALRSLCLIRERLARFSGLADAAFGAQIQGCFPIALSGDEDQRAIYLPGMAAGQNVVALALLDGRSKPAEVRRRDDGYVLSGAKSMVPLATIADRIVVLARHADETAARFSLFVVVADAVQVLPEAFVSPMPVGRVTFPDVEIETEARLGGEGQGLVIAQATLDMFRLPTASACLGIGQQALNRGLRELVMRGIGGRPLADQQGAKWELAECYSQLLAARSVTLQAAWKRDTTTAREVAATAVARNLAQEAAELSCARIANMIGMRGLKTSAPWERLLAEVRACRLDGEFLESARSVIANAMLAKAEAGRV